MDCGGRRENERDKKERARERTDQPSKDETPFCWLCLLLRGESSFCSEIEAIAFFTLQTRTKKTFFFPSFFFPSFCFFHSHSHSFSPSPFIPITTNNTPTQLYHIHTHTHTMLDDSIKTNLEWTSALDIDYQPTNPRKTSIICTIGNTICDP